MFSRAKPSGHHLALWIDEALIDDPGAVWPARGLWLAWSEYAAAIGVEPGTPRSFSNELRKAGFPCRKAPEVYRSVAPPSVRTRYHLGVTLRGPPLSTTDEGWATFCGWHDRYGQ